MTDPSHLNRILSNLLSNAIKYTRDGFVTLEVDSNQTHIVFQVIDTGIGISPDDQTRIFRSFVQVAEDIFPQLEGVGLGLVIVLELTELLGGEIDLHSEVGVGTRFTAKFPLNRL
jgi:signal transduction histidine kinase